MGATNAYLGETLEKWKTYNKYVLDAFESGTISNSERQSFGMVIDSYGANTIISLLDEGLTKAERELLNGYLKQIRPGVIP